MKKSMYKTKEEMPLFLTVMDVANLLGISRASAYELVRQENFPKLKIVQGRTIIPRDRLLEWLDEQTRYDRIQPAKYRVENKQEKEYALRKQRYSVHNSWQRQLFQGIQRFLTPQKSVGCRKGYCVNLCVAESEKSSFIRKNSGLCYALRKYFKEKHLKNLSKKLFWLIENFQQKTLDIFSNVWYVVVAKNKNEGGK